VFFFFFFGWEIVWARFKCNAFCFACSYRRRIQQLLLLEIQALFLYLQFLSAMYSSHIYKRDYKFEILSVTTKRSRPLSCSIPLHPGLVLQSNPPSSMAIRPSLLSKTASLGFPAMDLDVKECWVGSRFQACAPRILWWC